MALGVLKCDILAHSVPEKKVFGTILILIYLKEDKRSGLLREGKLHRRDLLQNQSRMPFQFSFPPCSIRRPLEQKDPPPLPNQRRAVFQNESGGERPGDEKIEARSPLRPTKPLQTIVDDRHPLQSKQADEMMEKGDLFPGRLDQRHLDLGTGDFQDQPRESGAGSDIDPALPGSRIQKDERGERI